MKIKRVFQQKYSESICTITSSISLRVSVVFQIPLSIITQALRISAFIVINEYSMDESFTDYSTFTSKMYRGLNLHFQIYVRFLLAIDNLRHKIEIIYVWCRFPHNIKCYSSNHFRNRSCLSTWTNVSFFR